jgi:hypothetical protein
MRETVNINGVYYDAKTGLPVEPDRPKLDTPPPKSSKPKKVAVRAPKKIAVSTAAQPAPVRAAHRPAASRTLNRRFVAKPPVKAKPAPIKPVSRPQTSPSLRPTLSTSPSPIVPRGTRRPTAQPTPAEPDMSPQEKRSAKFVSLIVAGAAAAIVAVGVLAYFNLPAVSFWVAASRAEVSASLPTYAPAGYSVAGQAQSSPGMVTIDYRSVSGSYSIQMANSNWDSDGVLENKVKPTATNYQTLNQKGLTIFVFNSQAIWVNGGVLYTIALSANLSNDEALKIVDGI